VANTSPDDVEELKQELAQFLLTEITSTQGQQTFRKEVSAEVAAVIDRVLTERLTPALQNIERQAAEQMNQLSARVDAALRRFEQAGPVPGASPETDQKVSDLTARLDEVRARLLRMEEQGRRAVAQPIAKPKLADERIAVTPKNSSLIPRWALWIIIALLALTALGLGNIYYERMMTPAAAGTNAPVFVTPPSASPPQTGTLTAPASTTPAPAIAPAQTAPPAPVSVPPQNARSNHTMTPTPISTAPPTVTAPASLPPQPAHSIPADFAIERGWLAAQPFAVEGTVARRAGTGGHITTLKSLACGRSASCTADSLLNGSQATQFIALQMMMSQIGDRFCYPRRGVHVTGEVDDGSLSEVAAVTRCAGLRPAAPCKEGENRVCPPDANAIEAGDVNALSQLLRWALWKTGST
jgi:hypothetical protein